MKNLTIGKRVGSLVIVMLVMLTAISAASFLALRQLEATLDFLDTDPLPGAKAIGQIARQNAVVQAAMLNVLASANPQDLTATKQQLDKEKVSFKQLLDAYEKTITQPEDRTMFTQVVQLSEKLTEAFGQAIAARQSSTEALGLVRKHLTPVVSELNPLLEKLVDWNEANGTRATAEGRTNAKAGVVRIGAMFGACFLIGSIGGFLGIRSINRALLNVIEQLESGAAQVASASTEIASTSQSLSQGSSEQAASLEEISASMEEMTAMTRRNSENATAATGMMAETAVQVERSNGALREMVTSMDAIKASSEKVAKINKTIDEIAFQTNILALNAAVEAARAGEAGMGFAVVADEVRNLAQRSAVAAKDTAALIEEAISNSNQGAAKLDQVATAIRGITESASKVKNLIEEVNEASGQQTQGINQVSTAINEVSRVTQTAAASAEESAAASEELSSQAQTVRDLLRAIQALAGATATAPSGSYSSPSYAMKDGSRPSGSRPRSEPAQSPVSRAEDEFPLDTPSGGGGSFRSF